MHEHFHVVLTSPCSTSAHDLQVNCPNSLKNTTPTALNREARNRSTKKKKLNKQESSNTFIQQ